jgi:hypothetical protein
MPDQLTDDEIICRFLWRLARNHGWSSAIPIPDLVAIANIPDEKRGRRLCETTLTNKRYVGYHRGRNVVWLKVPHDDLAYDLRDDCGYSTLRIEATLSHFSGF